MLKTEYVTMNEASPDPEVIRRAGQNYAEASEDDATYQIWIEDAESIERKLEVMESYGIAGVAEWALGLETEDVWDAIAAYVEKK